MDAIRRWMGALRAEQPTAAPRPIPPLDPEDRLSPPLLLPESDPIRQGTLPTFRSALPEALHQQLLDTLQRLSQHDVRFYVLGGPEMNAVETQQHILRQPAAHYPYFAQELAVGPRGSWRVQGLPDIVDLQAVHLGVVGGVPDEYLAEASGALHRCGYGIEVTSYGDKKWHSTDGFAPYQFANNRTNRLWMRIITPRGRVVCDSSDDSNRISQLLHLLNAGRDEGTSCDAMASALARQMDAGYRPILGVFPYRHELLLMRASDGAEFYVPTAQITSDLSDAAAHGRLLNTQYIAPLVASGALDAISAPQLRHDLYEAGPAAADMAGAVQAMLGAPLNKERGYSEATELLKKLETPGVPLAEAASQGARLMRAAGRSVGEDLFEQLKTLSREDREHFVSVVECQGRNGAEIWAALQEPAGDADRDSREALLKGITSLKPRDVLKVYRQARDFAVSKTWPTHATSRLRLLAELVTLVAPGQGDPMDVVRQAYNVSAGQLPGESCEQALERYRALLQNMARVHQQAAGPAAFHTLVGFSDAAEATNQLLQRMAMGRGAAEILARLAFEAQHREGVHAEADGVHIGGLFIET